MECSQDLGNTRRLISKWKLANPHACGWNNYNYGGRQTYRKHKDSMQKQCHERWQQTQHPRIETGINVLRSYRQKLMREDRHMGKGQACMYFWLIDRKTNGSYLPNLFFRNWTEYVSFLFIWMYILFLKINQAERGRVGARKYHKSIPARAWIRIFV